MKVTRKRLREMYEAIREGREKEAPVAAAAAVARLKAEFANDTRLDGSEVEPPGDVMSPGKPLTEPELE